MDVSKIAPVVSSGSAWKEPHRSAEALAVGVGDVVGGGIGRGNWEASVDIDTASSVRRAFRRAKTSPSEEAMPVRNDG